MKTPATPYRPLLLMFGAVAVVAVVAWNAETRSQATAGAAIDPITPTPAPAAVVNEPALAIETARAAEVPSASVPVESGMKAYLDPEGGLTHVPPQREAQPLASGPVRPERLPEVVLPDGSIKADLNGQFDEYTVMTIDENGNRVVHCVQHPDLAPGHAHPAAPVEREDR